MKYFNNKQQMYKRNKVLNRRDADNLIVASNRGYISLEDIETMLKEDVGIEVG